MQLLVNHRRLLPVTHASEYLYLLVCLHLSVSLYLSVMCFYVPLFNRVLQPCGWNPRVNCNRPTNLPAYLAVSLAIQVSLQVGLFSLLRSHMHSLIVHTRTVQSTFFRSLSVRSVLYALVVYSCLFIPPMHLYDRCELCLQIRCVGV